MMEVILAEKRKGPSEMSRGVISSEATEVMSKHGSGRSFHPSHIPSEGPTLHSHQALIEASHNRPGRGAENDRFQLHVIFLII